MSNGAEAAVAAARRNTRWAAVAPALATVYVLGTGAGRTARGCWRCRSACSRSWSRRPWWRRPWWSGRRWVDSSVVVVHIGAAAALGYLDGGVASPLGVLLYAGLPLLATMTTLRRFVTSSTIRP